VRRHALYGAAFGLLALAAVLAVVGWGEEPGALSDWQAYALGVVQGLTELLPISSSAHLILVPWLADWTYLENHQSFNQTFDVALHLGTLVAVASYFFHDIVALVAAWFRTLRKRSVETSDEKVAWIVLVATLPAAAVGVALEDPIATHLGEPWQIAILLAVFAGVLWLADRSPATRSADDLRLREALAIGIAQALALMPGVSRSGVTITAGRFLRLDRDAAARLSFLLLVPTVLGAVLLKGVGDVLLGDLPAGWEGPFLVGTIAAAGSGLLAIDWLLGYVRRHDYSIFVVYRLAVAAALVLLMISGVRATTF
jgi:undecaprenyl-diphosphatase